MKSVISAAAVKTLIADALAEDHAKIKFWVSEDSTSPAALFGGSWEEIASERVLMGASSTHAAGSTVEAGLPNIKGSSNQFDPNSGWYTLQTDGAFYTKPLGKTGRVTGDSDGSYPWYEFGMDASRCNSIYGASDTVQPAAYYVHIWHRVA